MSSFRSASVARTERVMRVGDLADRTGILVDSQDDSMTRDTPIFRGAFWHRELRSGLHVHASDVMEEADFTASSSQQAGLFCIFFLDGDVSVDMGEKRFAFHGDGRLRQAMVVSGARPETFTRLSKGHQKVRHLVVWATPEWLDSDCLPTLEDHRGAGGFLHDHLSDRCLAATPRMASLVDRLLTQADEVALYEQLLAESAAVELMAESFAASMQTRTEQPGGLLSSLDILRLRRAESYIDLTTAGQITVDAIAREAGVSVSGLQRLYQAAYGESVVCNIRRRRLQEARRRLLCNECTIKQAGLDAGYTSSANFSTAFKRQFGYSPGAL